MDALKENDVVMGTGTTVEEVKKAYPKWTIYFAMVWIIKGFKDKQGGVE